ncbi:MAG TPA: 3-oxoacyl-ACP reductase family protein [Bryobacterales bacterium]|jgi:3-oxoacyl-[acyl-carrier protein] reductase|nr:3-oxoacyl-ACP reductase family protein [Bryobacterales bacterium]
MPQETGYFSRRLEGRVALVTGASRGIGRAIAIRLALEGAAVAVNFRSEAKAAGETVERIRSLGGQAFAVQADVADPASAGRLVAETCERFGGIDVLVNNAGILYRGDIFNYNAEEFYRMHAANTGGVANTAAAVAPRMKEKKSGSIVNITSIAALGTAMHGTTFYAATKAAVIILTKRFALELGPFGVNVNAVAPGFIQTDMTFAGRTPEEAQQVSESMKSRTMLGRVGKPEDIASVVAFLASPDARFVTGQILTADGGRLDFLTHGL